MVYDVEKVKAVKRNKVDYHIKKMGKNQTFFKHCLIVWSVIESASPPSVVVIVVVFWVTVLLLYSKFMNNKWKNKIILSRATCSVSKGNFPGFDVSD